MSNFEKSILQNKTCLKPFVIQKFNLFLTIQSGLGKMQATMWAFDLETGETVWQTKLGEIYNLFSFFNGLADKVG